MTTYYPINENLARASHDMRSMSTYPDGYATREYRASVDKAAALVEEKKQKVSPYYHEKLDALLDSYARRLAQWTDDHNRNGASCPSVLVCGAGNFPVRKKQKQNAREDTLWHEYEEIEAILTKIKAVGTGPVDLADPHARELLTDQLNKEQDLLEYCKGANAYYRKHKTLRGYSNMSDAAADALTSPDAFSMSLYRKPYGDFELTSIRGKIKRIQTRLDELDKAQASAASGPVDLADPHARELLTDQLNKEQDLLEYCKGANAYYRKHKTLRGYSNMSDAAADALTSPDAFSMSLYRKPYGDFELTSIRGKIKRIQTRLDELDKAQASAASGPVEDQHDGYTYRENNEIMRVQFIFPGKPDDETRTMLKENGFRWAPSQGAWQRQLTANAKYAAHRVIEFLDGNENE
ncbi:MAG: hypothetical protein ACLUH7_10510 [Faecalibacterium prausnitzii]